MIQLLKPLEIKTFNEKSVGASQLQRQYTTQFQCTICCFINQDLALAEIHQMGCLLQSKLKENQNWAITSKGSRNQTILPHENLQEILIKNEVEQENEQIPSPLNSQKFDMMKYIGLKSFHKNHHPIYSKKDGYKCKFCKCQFHSKATAIHHLYNSHFLEIQQMLQFTDEINTEKSESQNFHEILFKPFPEQAVLKFYKCNYCSYTSEQKFRLHQHLKRFCSFFKCQLQDNQIKVAKDMMKQQIFVNKNRCKAEPIYNIKLEEDQREKIEELNRVCGDQLESQNVKKQQEGQ